MAVKLAASFDLEPYRHADGTLRDDWIDGLLIHSAMREAARSKRDRDNREVENEQNRHRTRN